MADDAAEPDRLDVDQLDLDAPSTSEATPARTPLTREEAKAVKKTVKTITKEAKKVKKAPTEENVAALQQLVMRQTQQLGIEPRGSGAPKESYAFWQTQPVAQFNEDPTRLPAQDGPIEPPRTVADVRQEPYPLPPGFEWSLCNMQEGDIVKEVYELLTYNYVEDDEAMFRFNYSREFLRWALQPPGFDPDWHLGVRVSSSRKLVGFITGVPAHLTVRGRGIQLVEINFLCVHKKLRSKRLAPVLIKEITRRVNLKGIWQAAYTAGVVLPKPLAQCQYWHRSLNPKKLIAVGFSRLNERMTMVRTIKLYKLPDRSVTPHLRPLERADVPEVTALLNRYLAGFALAPQFTEEEVEHYLLPVPDVVASYVVQPPGGAVTDLLSFYTLPSTVIGNAQYSTLKAAFQYYTVPGATPLEQLMGDALILARDQEHDVFNALDIFANASFLKPLKFGIGDGMLRYYLFNWRVTADLQPSDVGLIML